MVRVPTTEAILAPVLDLTTTIPSLAMAPGGAILDGHVATVVDATIPTFLEARHARGRPLQAATASEGRPLVRTSPKEDAPTP